MSGTNPTGGANKARSTTATSRTAARLSFAAFLVLLAALHLLKPGLDPSWRMVSEYEIGRHGWVMRLAFLLLGSSSVALFAAVRSQVCGQPAAASGWPSS